MGDGVIDERRAELAQSAKNALIAYAEGYGAYKDFKRAHKALADYDANAATA